MVRPGRKGIRQALLGGWFAEMGGGIEDKTSRRNSFSHSHSWLAGGKGRVGPEKFADVVVPAAAWKALKFAEEAL